VGDPRAADFIDSTNPETVAALTQAAATLAGEFPSGTVLMEPRLCWSVDLWADCCRESACLIFVEPPDAMLARAMATGDAAQLEAHTGAWLSGAENILAFVRRNRSRAVLIDAREAYANPQALVERCCEWIGDSFDAPAAAPPADSCDPLFILVAKALADSDTRIQRVWAELDVSCRPLSDDETFGGVFVDAAAQASAAASALGALLTGRGLRPQLEEAQQENELLLLQLHQVQEEL
jgi:hypothetical protein